MSEKKKGGGTAEFFEDLEEGYAPLAGAPRHFGVQTAAPGYEDVAGDAVRAAVLQALIEAGYGRVLAQKMADEVAEKLPSIQQKAEEQVAA